MSGWTNVRFKIKYEYEFRPVRKFVSWVVARHSKGYR